MYDDQFDAAAAEGELRDYRRHGPNAWTARLIEELCAGGVDGKTVLDIGAGVGVVHHALLEAGAATAVDVDASGPYIAVSRREAERRRVADRVTYHKGDAVAVVPTLPEADLVVLDRVVCCYGDMPGLVAAAASRTRGRLGIVVPRDRGWIRAWVGLENRWNALRRDPFRFHVHPVARVLDVARAAGLTERSASRGLFWQLLVLEREG